MKSSQATGFTLIEVGIAVFIISMLAVSMLVPLVTRVETAQVRETQAILAEAREALLGFAAANGYLPCPDKTTAGGAGAPNDGMEDVNGFVCVTTNGNLPVGTLGLDKTADAWGNRLRYRVVAEYAQRSPAIFTFTSPGTSGFAPLRCVPQLRRGTTCSRIRIPQPQ
jgi:type II secretory pathway pseudopilin PulG